MGWPWRAAGRTSLRFQDGGDMRSARITITFDRDVLARLDRWVKERRFPSRSRAVQAVLSDTLDRLDRGRLARECAKLDPAFEQELADGRSTEAFG